MGNALNDTASLDSELKMKNIVSSLWYVKVSLDKDTVHRFGPFCDGMSSEDMIFTTIAKLTQRIEALEEELGLARSSTDDNQDIAVYTEFE